MGKNVMSDLRTRVDAAYMRARELLLAERNALGAWTGELSASALSTATAVMALSLVDRAQGSDRHAALVDGGFRWLAAHQNADGGWGDTTLSFSNLSTTMLCRAAHHLCRRTDTEALRRAESWLFTRYGKSPEKLAEAVRARYGKDRTFAVPILTTCALAGLVSWREVPSLPFELAVLPQSWFRFVKLHVVSYALPALIAIGQCIDVHRGTWNPVARLARWAARRPSLNVLRAIQPTSGGFLEATPLTSFVALSLASIGHADHPVTELGVAFLERSALADGSWAIDTNLATWVTTLAVNALAAGDDVGSLDGAERIRDWLLGQQYRVRHPYTGAAPGGWAWTDLPGGVPDADDTPGALLALAILPPSAPVADAVRAGVTWLLDLQNRDGGWPTFCRGWGHLPFDRSGSDLTAHALRALHVHRAVAPERIARATQTGLAYLAKTQRPDGSWLPLWFGNQHVADDENPVYGTARVLAAFRDFTLNDWPHVRRGAWWLASVANADGGWGGGLGAPSSVEETALAVDALCAFGEHRAAVQRGAEWLIARAEAGRLSEVSPIGFYFAKLWYHEKLYPLVSAVSALGRVRTSHRFAQAATRRS